MGSKNQLYSEAQKRVVATLLADESDQNRVFELISDEDFLEPKYKIIFQAVIKASRENQGVTPITVAKKLEEAGMLATVGGVAELYSLRTSGLNWLLEAPVEVYSLIVREQSAKSRIQTVIAENSKFLKPDSGTTAVEAIGLMQNEFNSALYSLSDESTISQMTDSMDAYLALLEDRKAIAERNADTAEGLQGIPSLLPTLNRYTTGWLPGQMITVGARTGVGKSIFAVNCAIAAAKAGKSVLFFSLEMGEDEIKDRMISSTTGVSLNALKQGRISDDDRKVLEQEKDDLNRMKIQIDIDPKVTVDSIRARALRRAQSPEGLDFIVIDYLQLITPVGRFTSRQEAVADISRNVKLLAKQLGIPIMVLVQVNRESKDDENPIPKLHQVRESGAIAQDSDIVILLHREEATDDTTPHTLILLEKNRNGEAQKTIRCHSNLECSLFREVQRDRNLNPELSEDEENSLNQYSEDEDLSFDDDLNFDEGEDLGF